MAKPNSICFAILFLAFTLTGCGNQLSTVQASAPTAPDPAASNCTPSPLMCDAHGCTETRCAAWGYCQMSSLVMAHSFTVGIEVGITTNITDPNDSICNLWLASGGNIDSITGTVDYKSWRTGGAAGSMALNLRACATNDCPYPAAQEHLYSAKYGTDPGLHQTVPFSAHFDSPMPARRLMLVFNDDLAQAKPTTLSMGFSGTFK